MINQSPLLLDKNREIAVLTFNRPEVHNAMNTETVVTALAMLEELKSDKEIKVLIFTGASKAFIAGADIAEMSRKDPEQARSYSELGHKLMHEIERLEKPVIAAINGYCLGGGMEVALASDIRISADNARFGLPETILGIIPGWGAIPRATRLIGAAFAKELIFTGDIVNAQRALQIGLVNHVVAGAELMSFVMEMAEKICKQSQFAVACAKDVINMSVDSTLTDVYKTEVDTFVSCFEAGDYKVGMRAFLEKRKPKFG